MSIYISQFPSGFKCALFLSAQDWRLLFTSWSLNNKDSLSEESSTGAELSRPERVKQKEQSCLVGESPRPPGPGHSPAALFYNWAVTQLCCFHSHAVSQLSSLHWIKSPLSPNNPHNAIWGFLLALKWCQRPLVDKYAQMKNWHALLIFKPFLDHWNIFLH